MPLSPEADIEAAEVAETLGDLRTRTAPVGDLSAISTRSTRVSWQIPLATVLTFDHGYRRAELEALSISVLNPDAYLIRLLAEEPDAVVASVRATARVWGGGRPVGELIDAFARAGTTGFTERLRVAGL